MQCIFKLPFWPWDTQVIHVWWFMCNIKTSGNPSLYLTNKPCTASCVSITSTFPFQKLTCITSWFLIFILKLLSAFSAFSLTLGAQLESILPIIESPFKFRITFWNIKQIFSKIEKINAEDIPQSFHINVTGMCGWILPEQTTLFKEY